MATTGPEAGDPMEGYEEEEIISRDEGDNTEETQFDTMVGILQDILIDPQFVEMQSTFCEAHCESFEDATENKLIYTSVFNQYSTMIENFLERRLSERIEHFSMDELVRLMQENEDEIPGDIIDMLSSCLEFEEFKSFMLSFKQNETPNIEITGDPLVCCSE